MGDGGHSKGGRSKVLINFGCQNVARGLDFARSGVRKGDPSGPVRRKSYDFEFRIPLWLTSGCVSKSVSTSGAIRVRRLFCSGSAAVAAGQSIRRPRDRGVRRGGPVRSRCSFAGEGEKGIRNREETSIEGGGLRCSNHTFVPGGVSPRARGTGGARRAEMLPFP